MIDGIHAIIYSRNAEQLRAFFRDVLGSEGVDAGGGWPIFALPPAELAVHPSADDDRHELFLMTRDLPATIAALRSRGVSIGEVSEERWGLLTSIELPGGGSLGLYEPRHPSPLFPAG
jgi:catechol 2,3-dioxygenase-like lactoylglutathione lyase family enzyme